MVEITRICRPHRGQRSTLNPNVLFIIVIAHARRLDHPKSSPSSMRSQCATEIIVGSRATTGPAGTATTACPRVATASVGSAAAKDAAASDAAAAGDADAGDATRRAGAGEGAGNAAASVDADAGADGVAEHGFGLAAWAGGFVVTSQRHDERDAKMSW